MNIIKPKSIIYPSKFYSNRVMYLQDVEEELKEILERSGEKGRIVKILEKRYEILHEKMELSLTSYHQWFEDLTQVKDIYSIHKIPGDANLRILFMFASLNGRDKVAILLRAFSETASDKRLSKKNYAPNIKIALARKEEIELLIEENAL